MKTRMLFPIALCVSAAACGDDDNQQPMARTFTVQIDNVRVKVTEWAPRTSVAPQ